MASAQGLITISAGTLTDQMFSGASGDVLTAAKQQHVFKVGPALGVAIGGTPATREDVVYTATGSGTVLLFRAGLNVTGSSTSITFDLKKNGVSILSAVITVTNANTNRQLQSATISSASFSTGDVFSIAMTVSSSTGAQGPIVTAAFQENAVPS